MLALVPPALFEYLQNIAFEKLVGGTELEYCFQ